ncbi:hypothetical protein, partial [Escherichia coli]|uniref:hypothetical protein n=1 Tax=Escherichia coli TaxID=562 RepID=UPI001953BEA7
FAKSSIALTMGSGFSRYGVTNKCISILVSILKAKVNINIKYMNIYGVLAYILFPNEFIKLE